MRKNFLNWDKETLASRPHFSPERLKTLTGASDIHWGFTSGHHMFTQPGKATGPIPL